MDLKKLLSKDEEPEMGMKDKSKLEVLEELRDTMSELMSKGLGGDEDSMKKVTIAANDTEGLEEGLDTAEDIVESMPEDEDMDMLPSEDEEELSLEEIDKKMAELEEMKMRLMGE